MATRAERLYKDDFYAWTRNQASALRRLADERWNGPLDLLHLAEEVEDLGSEQRWAVESQLERIIEHLLKLEHSPNAQPRRQWMISVNTARGEVQRRLSRTIRGEVEPPARQTPLKPCPMPAPTPSTICSLTSGGPAIDMI
jgi:hypothetical protein